MAMQQKDRERLIDEASEESFPASDPPSFTPSSRVASQPCSDEDARERTVEAEKAERARDPHGVAPAKHADKDEPAAAPSPDRHRTETTIERVGKKDK